MLSCGFNTRTVEVDRKTICSVMQVREEHFTMASLDNYDGCSVWIFSRVLGNISQDHDHSNIFEWGKR